MQNKKGFTLLELLVVVLIIGILASIALPQYQMAVAKSKYTALKVNARALKTAIDVYHLKRNEFPTDLDELDIELSGEIDGDEIDFADGSYCYLYDNESGTRAIRCVKELFNIPMEYVVFLSGAYKDRAACAGKYPTKEDKVKVQKFCKQETGNLQAGGIEEKNYDSFLY